MKKLRLVAGILISWFVCHLLIIAVYGLFAKPTNAEYIVILGNKVNENGSLSNRLKARVDAGLELYNSKLAPKIVVSGGFGEEGYYEAEKMAEYLLAKGVRKNDVLIDNFGNTTWLTASNFKKQYPKAQSVIVVSQFFHLSRCKLAFKKVGVDTISTYSPSYYELKDFYSLFREFFAYYKYLLFYNSIILS